MCVYANAARVAAETTMPATRTNHSRRTATTAATRPAANGVEHDAAAEGRHRPGAAVATEVQVEVHPRRHQQRKRQRRCGALVRSSWCSLRQTVWRYGLDHHGDFPDVAPDRLEPAETVS